MAFVFRILHDRYLSEGTGQKSRGVMNFDDVRYSGYVREFVDKLVGKLYELFLDRIFRFVRFRVNTRTLNSGRGRNSGLN